MIKIFNYLQKEQLPKPLYLFENTYPGAPGQYPKVDKVAELIESFIGAPVVIDAAGLGSAAPRVRLFWTNWIRPEILQHAIPTDVLPCPPLRQILNNEHVSTWPTKYPRAPFAMHNKVGRERVAIVEYTATSLYIK